MRHVKLVIQDANRVPCYPDRHSDAITSPMPTVPTILAILLCTAHGPVASYALARIPSVAVTTHSEWVTLHAGDQAQSGQDFSLGLRI